MKMLETFINQYFLDVLRISPMNSLTPFEIENFINGNKEFLFVAKLSPYMYEPFLSPQAKGQTQIQIGMYFENENLIIRFVLFDVILESEIRKEKISQFLSVFKHQQIITLAILDGNTYDLIWGTNKIDISKSKENFKPIFEAYL